MFATTRTNLSDSTSKILLEDYTYEYCNYIPHLVHCLSLRLPLFIAFLCVYLFQPDTGWDYVRYESLVGQ
jgi:hypothetical protein